LTWRGPQAPDTDEYAVYVGGMSYGGQEGLQAHLIFTRRQGRSRLAFASDLWQPGGLGTRLYFVGDVTIIHARKPHAVISGGLGFTPKIARIFRLPVLLHKCLKDCISTVLIEFDADLSPEIVGKIIQLPTRGDWHQ
jgi:hypothetical protein